MCVEEVENREIIDFGYLGLDDRERTLIQMRFEEGKTLKMIGDFFGISSERVRQIEFKALRKIKAKIQKELK